MLFAAILILTALFVGHTSQPKGPAEDRTHEEIVHLPQEIQDGIVSWRERLRSAVCLKVVCETDETWRDMYRLDETGNPVVVLRERFQVHAWMTPDMLWMVIFPYSGETVDATTPHYQLLWKKSPGLVWERAWDPSDGIYRASRYSAPSVFGAENGSLYSKGCVYATVMQSWLAGEGDLADPRGMFPTIAFLRKPNLSIVPPDPNASGVWLDVFQDELTRDSEIDPDEVYRRHDFMLLARDDMNHPELREWRTIVLADPRSGGMKPQEITAIRRFSYQFFESIPEALRFATDAFEQDVDEIVSDSP